jgi:2-polyprenyl-3-methyl-5-hydroxy-6-metoxy-1,4-benzoquinol methylase
VFKQCFDYAHSSNGQKFEAEHRKGSLDNMPEFPSSYQGTENLEAMEFAKNYNRFLANLVLNAIPTNSARILDFGAGIGTFATALTREGRIIDCLEPDLKQGELIAQKGLKTFKSLVEISPGSYDFIYSLNVLEHIKDDAKVVSELGDALRLGGLAFMYVPAFNILFSSMDKFVGHHRRYNMKTLKSLFPSQKWEIVAVRYADSMGFFASLYLKIFGKKDGRISSSLVSLYDSYLFPASLASDRIFHRWFGKNVWIIAKRIK